MWERRFRSTHTYVNIDRTGARAVQEDLSNVTPPGGSSMWHMQCLSLRNEADLALRDAMCTRAEDVFGSRPLVFAVNAMYGPTQASSFDWQTNSAP